LGTNSGTLCVPQRGALLKAFPTRGWERDKTRGWERAKGI